MRHFFLYRTLLPVFISLFAAFALFFSCDKIEFPYIRPEPAAPVDTVQKIQKVLLEEYTGHSCGNCPTADATAIGLQQARSGKMVIVEIHYGLLATPIAPPFNYDFRTGPGNEYGILFKTEDHPIGLINRMDFLSNTHKKQPGTWSGIIDSLLGLQPPVLLNLTNSFDQNSHILATEVNIDITDTLAVRFNLILWLIEDSVKKPQEDYSKPAGQQVILDYWHRHVYRAAINSTWGDSLTVSALPGEKIKKNYSYIVPDNFKGLATRYNQCSVVAVIYDAESSSPSYRIIQVEEKKIM